MTQNQTKTITIKKKMTENLKTIYKRYYQWLCICRKYIMIVIKFSMPFNIGIANLSHTWCST